MLKFYDSFLTNMFFAALIVLVMFFSESLLVINYSAMYDLLYGAFCAVGGSFLGETIKVLTLGRYYNWKHLLIGAPIGLILAYIIFALL